MNYRHGAPSARALSLLIQLKIEQGKLLDWTKSLSSKYTRPDCDKILPLFKADHEAQNCDCKDEAHWRELCLRYFTKGLRYRFQSDITSEARSRCLIKKIDCGG